MNTKKTVNVSSLVVKADQRRAVQFVQRNFPAPVLHYIRVANKLGECQSHFPGHHVGLRVDSEGAQLKWTGTFSFVTF